MKKIKIITEAYSSTFETSLNKWIADNKDKYTIHYDSIKYQVAMSPHSSTYSAMIIYEEGINL